MANNWMCLIAGGVVVERSPYDLSGPVEAVLVLACFYGLGVVAWMREVRLGRMGVDDFAVVVIGPFLWFVAIRDLLLRFQQWYAPAPPDNAVFGGFDEIIRRVPPDDTAGPVDIEISSTTRRSTVRKSEGP